MVVALAFLMVSTFRYHSFKGIDLKSRRSYVSVVGIAVALVVLFLHTEGVLAALTTLYALSGPSAYLFGLLRRRGGSPPVVAADPAPRSV